MNSMTKRAKSIIQDYLLLPIQQFPAVLKTELDQFINLKTIYKWTFLLLVSYFVVPPLLYNVEPVDFHLIKLNTMYIAGGLLVLTLLFGYQHFPYLSEYWNKYKRGIRLVGILFLLMIFSLAINLPQMNLFVRAEVITTSVFYGAGPNFISIFYYWLGLILLFSVPIVIPQISKKLLFILIVLSLFITAMVLIYQVFVFDFMGVGRTYLFGFGNSNYTADAFAVIGLFLTIPMLYEEKINVYRSLIGILFFVIVLVSLSRAAFLGLFAAAIGSVIYLVVMKQLNVKRFSVLFGLALVTFALALSVFALTGDTTIFGDLTSFTDLITGQRELSDVAGLRTPLWGSAIEMWLYGSVDGTEVFGLNWGSILFGNGQSVYIWQTETTQFLVTNVHQMYLDILMSLGIFGFGIFMYFLYQLSQMALKLSKSNMIYIPLLSALMFTFTKWFFNSLNGLHAPFIYLIAVLILSEYLRLDTKNSQL